MMTANTVAVAWTTGLLRATLEGAVTTVLIYLLALPLRTRVPRVCVWMWRLVFAKFMVSLAGLGLPISVLRTTAGTARTPEVQDLDILALAILSASIVGIALRATKYFEERAGIRRLMASAVPVSCRQTRWRLEELRFAFGLSRSPALLVSELAEGPLLVGGRNAAIILPPRLLAELSEIEIDLVLRHELAHIRYRDLSWGWLPFVADLLFFFHPLVHLAHRELALAQEIACDQAALAMHSGERTTYARLLLSLSTEREGATPAHAGTMGLSESYHLLELRFHAISTLPGRRLNERLQRALGAAAFCLLAPLVALTGSVGPAPVPVAATLRTSDTTLFSPARPRFTSSPVSARAVSPAAASIAGPIHFSGDRPPRP
jgi:beta-lactamase regulating signal transducer with metallopeptidase domain